MKTEFVLKGRWENTDVWFDGEWLNPYPSLRVFNHSPTGFAWGYGGSGPAQLALAILLKCGFTEEQAVAQHQQFKWDVIARLPEADFELKMDVSKYL